MTDGITQWQSRCPRGQARSGRDVLKKGRLEVGSGCKQAGNVGLSFCIINLLLEQHPNVLIKMYLIFFVKAQLMFNTKQNI